MLTLAQQAGMPYLGLDEASSISPIRPRDHHRCSFALGSGKRSLFVGLTCAYRRPSPPFSMLLTSGDLPIRADFLASDALAEIKLFT